MVLVNRNVAPSFNTIIEILQNDQRKIKLIRKYENTRKKIINNECAILFNKTCIYVYICTVTERMRNHAQHGSIINHLRECHSISKIKTVELVNSVKILARGATKQELLILEALYIKEEQPSLNGQEEGRDRVLQIF